jgi:ribose 5-phosphate isomerase A
MSELQDQMKQAVATAAVAQIQDGMVLGLGSGL